MNEIIWRKRGRTVVEWSTNEQSGYFQEIFFRPLIYSQFYVWKFTSRPYNDAGTRYTDDTVSFYCHFNHIS